jgi:hypothetical protein
METGRVLPRAAGRLHLMEPVRAAGHAVVPNIHRLVGNPLVRRGSGFQSCAHGESAWIMMCHKGLGRERGDTYRARSIPEG